MDFSPEQFLQDSSNEGSVHSRNLKMGPTGPLPGKKVGTLQKNVGPQVITHLIGLVFPCWPCFHW